MCHLVVRHFLCVLYHMKYLSQASGYRMVHLCLFPNPSINLKKVNCPFFVSGKKTVYLQIMWITSGITAMFRT